MKSALLCLFFALLVRIGSRADDDFRPIPIPLDSWQYENTFRREGRAGTLHEAMHTEPAAVAAIPAHYWEDALRHSVYLTLVRDKIDQLIAKGDFITPDAKPDVYLSKDIDDHDLWEKIKAAPFDRKQAEELPSFGDVTILAKGRLVETNGGFRFTEDDRAKDRCSDDKCLASVKAFWSVKRVRQRDSEISPGKYHYELTFSVNSQQTPKKQKPYENPVRTFTVRESSHDQVLDMPQENRNHERMHVMHTSRPSRAIWYHKNIVTSPQHHHYQSRQFGLERIFSSLFSDDDDEYEPPRRPQQNTRQPWLQYHYSKVGNGNLGAPSDQQKRLTPYPYKPHTYKYTRPTAPQYVDSDPTGNHYPTPPHYRYPMPPTPKPLRTAVLPTPLPPVTPPTKNWTEADTVKPVNFTENSTKVPELIIGHKPYNKPMRPAPMKVNYFPEHVRPPIYNAPPGVFVTMDKKPFKPLPPLKFITKPMKQKPADFRPSPQVLEMQHFSEPNAQPDTAFRPIMWDFNQTFTPTTTEKLEVAESTQGGTTRKTTPKGKKPPKKHENIRPTPAAPDIITASSDSVQDGDTLWANVVGAFSWTTPMAPEKKSEAPDTTTTTTTTSTTTTSSTKASTTTAAVKRRTTTTTEATPETTTTPKPKPKRTRPPPKFAKTDKFKKLKRNRTTTARPQGSKTTQDLTPLASSAAVSKPSKPQTTSTTTSTTSTTTPRPTTKITTSEPTTTTTTTAHTTTTTTEHTVRHHTASTTQPKINNRFRQSTLMYKGTSVKHDKWSATPAAPTSPEKSKATVSIQPDRLPPRRKGSNFHGYVSSTTPRNEKEYEKFHEDHGPIKNLAVKPLSTTDSYDDADQNKESDHEDLEYDSDNDFATKLETEEQESRDDAEYIFPTTTVPSQSTNEVDNDSEESITTEQIITTTLSAPKNKTKCKKKQNATTTEKPFENEITIATTDEPTTKSYLDELISSFTENDDDSKSVMPLELQEQGSEKVGRFVKLDDDLQKFLDSLEGEGESNAGSKTDSEDEYDDENDKNFDDEGHDELDTARDSSYVDYEANYHEPENNAPSLFELLAME